VTEEAIVGLVKESPVVVVLVMLWHRIGKMEGHQELIMRNLKIEPVHKRGNSLMGALVIFCTVAFGHILPGCALNRPYLLSVTTETNGAVHRSIGKITTVAIGPGMADVMRQTARQSSKSGQSIGQSGVETSAGITTNDTRALGDIRAILGR
jgi:hypothetical protein